MKKLLLLSSLLLLTACHKAGLQPEITPTPVNLVPEIEPNNDIIRATFVSNLTPPDQITYYGELIWPQDIDYYHFFTLSDQLTSLVITPDSNIALEVFMYSRDLEHDELNVLGHWIGDPGSFILLNFPTLINDDGFIFSVSMLSQGSAKYKVEIWSPGFVH